MKNTIIEIQLNDDGSIENSYRVDSEEGLPLYNWVVQQSPELSKFFKNIELISSAPIDNLTVHSKSVVIVLDHAPHEGLMNYFAFKVTDSGEVTKKYYAPLEKLQHNIKLPQSAILADQFGVGFYPESDVDVFDRYFFHTNQAAVESFFNKKLPQFPEYTEGLKLFGITHNSAGEIKKLKRYIFPEDPQILHPERL